MTQAPKTLLTDLRVGETLKIGDATVMVSNKSGRMVRLSVVAPRSTKISKPCAQECASSPHRGSKEHPHERTAASM